MSLFLLLLGITGHQGGEEGNQEFSVHMGNVLGDKEDDGAQFASATENVTRVVQLVLLRFNTLHQVPVYDTWPTRRETMRGMIRRDKLRCEGMRRDAKGCEEMRSGGKEVTGRTGQAQVYLV